MFFNSDLTHKLDFEKSNLKVLKKSPLKKVYLDVNVPSERDDIIKFHRNEVARSIFKSLVPEKGYAFKEGFDYEQMDVFRVGHFDLSFYISHKVKVALQEANITGAEYVEAPHFL